MKVKNLCFLFFISLVLLLVWQIFPEERNLFEIINKNENKINLENIWPEKLKNPPSVIKGIYVTSWVAGNEKRMAELIELIDQTELNAIVIDVKDFSGYLAFPVISSFLKSFGTEQIRIKNFAQLVNQLHQKNIYVIARITVFQDPVLAEKRPDLAIRSKRTGKIWKDNKGLAWVDPASFEVWNYILAIAKEVDRYGVDELNFDYLRFPSDGDLKDLSYPIYDEKKGQREILKEFFDYLSKNLRKQNIKISADFFGLVTVNKDDLGIGQILEDFLPYFDYLCPMVYPSHYASGFLSYKNPALYPYEVIKYSLENAKKRVDDFKKKYPDVSVGEFRPWLQDFDLGANYDEKMVRLEKKAVVDVGLSNGWLLWDPKNIYTRTALDKE